MTAPTNINFFADFQGIAALKNDAKTQAPTALKEAARQFESLFTQMLLKSMREANKSFGEDSLFGSDQGDMYQDMFDDQMAMQLSQGQRTRTGGHAGAAVAGRSGESCGISGTNRQPPTANRFQGRLPAHDAPSRRARSA